MDNKKIIIIGIIVLIIAACIIFVMLTSVNYEKIEITPNGTTMEVLGDNKTNYDGEIEGVKIWNWDKGILVAYNSHEDENLIQVSELGFNTLNDLIKTGEKQNIDGLTCYVINADELLQIQLFDFIKVNYNNKFYCIPLSNETTGDNIIICSIDEDTAVHMAQSVQYKNVYPNGTALDGTLAVAENVAEELVSDYINDTNVSDIESIFKEKTGVDMNVFIKAIEEYTGKLSV